MSRYNRNSADEQDFIATEMLAFPSNSSINLNDSDLTIAIQKWEDNSYISSTEGNFHSEF